LGVAEAINVARSNASAWPRAEIRPGCLATGAPCHPRRTPALRRGNSASWLAWQLRFGKTASVTSIELSKSTWNQIYVAAAGITEEKG
jgi:hypothetical protein